MREELAYRTMVMSAEMEKWRQQAALTANAVLDAKNDVMERKKELDHTKDKMDRLLEVREVSHALLDGSSNSTADPGEPTLRGACRGMPSLSLPCRSCTWGASTASS